MSDFEVKACVWHLRHGVWWKTTARRAVVASNQRVPYVISALVTVQSSGDMVKQLQCGLAPNSRLQSKSGGKGFTYLDSLRKKRGGWEQWQIVFTDFSSHEYSSTFFLLLYALNKQITMVWLFIILISFQWIQTKTICLLKLEMFFLSWGIAALITKHFPFALLQSTNVRAHCLFNSPCLGLW